MSLGVSVCANLKCRLGEGLHWDGRREVLWLVDILSQELIRFNPVTGESDRRRMPEPIGWVLGVKDCEMLLVGLESGIALVESVSSGRSMEWVDRSFPGVPGLRLNDAKVDKFGRVWAGSTSLTNDRDPVGSLARYSFDGSGWEVVDAGYAVPNGPAFNADCSVMLHSDSTRRTVYRYDLDPVKGTILGRSVWRQFSPDTGLPDGMTFDEDGFIWIAHWGLGQVRRYDLDGEMHLAVVMPTPHVTNVCFGGPLMDRLFVTSARHGLTSPDPLAGALFEISDHGTRGLPQWEVPSAMTGADDRTRIS